MAAALAGSPFRQLRTETERRLTDGTENFLGILALEVSRDGTVDRGLRKEDGRENALQWVQGLALAAFLWVGSLPGLESRAVFLPLDSVVKF